jgi:CHRD domain-containing protein
MGKLYLGSALVVAVTLMSAGSSIADENKRGNIKARLSGFQEVPAISSTASGEFAGTINQEGDAIEFTLKYSNMSSAAAAAHIHLGQAGVNGGVIAFLCGGGSKPACPAGNTDTVVTVTGTIVAADVTGPAGQGIAAGEFAEVLKAIRAGVTYANVHTAGPPNGLYPGGEIRGAIRGRGRGHGFGLHHDDDDDDD